MALRSRKGGPGYTISALERESGIPRRTIHYYISRDLLPPSEGSGPHARYAEEHLLRLRLISALKGADLRLSGIRQILDGMSLEEMRRLAGQDRRTSPEWLATLLPTAPDEGHWSPPPARFAALAQRLGGSVEESATWRRLRVLPALEIHYRPGEGSAFMAKMKRLLVHVREIFSDEIDRQRRLEAGGEGEGGGPR